MDRVPRLLIYLPCYDDFNDSFEQVERLKKQHLELVAQGRSRFELRVMVSVDSPHLHYQSEATAGEIFNTFSFGHYVSGDVNISLGFINSLYEDADFLWILSSNDRVSEECLLSIQEFLIDNLDVDILVSGTIENKTFCEVRSVLEDVNPKLRFGLISAVIYKVESIRRNLDIALRLSWTGWGHLALLESVCMQNGSLKCMAVPESILHEPLAYRGQERMEQRTRNRARYAHSYFGGLVLLTALYSNDKHQLRELINKWIRRNWYYRSFYSKGILELIPQHKSGEVGWIEVLSIGTIRLASLQYRILFSLGNIVPYMLIMKSIDVLRNR